MFFRRQIPHQPTFEERLEALKRAGFAVQPQAGGNVRVTRGCYAAVISKNDDGTPRFAQKPGVVIGGAIGTLIDGGYQKFFETPDRKRVPALAEDLRGVHELEEDLRENLGLKSLYNEALGTVSNKYLYDRVKDRDRGVPKRAWE